MGRVTPRRSYPLAQLALSLLLIMLLGMVGPIRARATSSLDAFENCLLEHANVARAAAGLGDLQMAHDIVAPVRDWSEWMRFNELEHMPDSVRQDILPDSWTTWSENIAMHSDPDMSDCERVHDLWMSSAPHRANILNSGVRFVAIGAYVDSSGWWATQLFFDATGYPASCRGSFCDDDASPFEGAIEQIAGADITQGCNPPLNNRFCPDVPVTRGAMAAFLARALGLPKDSSIDFRDVSNSVFADSIERIAGADITRGCNPPLNDKFCPDEYVTRAQMAAFLVRALNLSPGRVVDFSDDNGSRFESDIEAIAAAGITTGCNPPYNTKFCPDDYVTRGQMAAFLARALDL
ncbi:MAG TPA: S-layer homology domain-containing protein [Acidimicrobiia bacterium]